jgi:hypothetical protein
MIERFNKKIGKKLNCRQIVGKNKCLTGEI